MSETMEKFLWYGPLVVNLVLLVAICVLAGICDKKVKSTGYMTIFPASLLLIYLFTLYLWTKELITYAPLNGYYPSLTADAIGVLGGIALAIYFFSYKRSNTTHKEINKYLTAIGSLSVVLAVFASASAGYRVFREPKKAADIFIPASSSFF